MGPAGVVAGAAAGAYTASLVGGMGNTEKDSEGQPKVEDVRPAEALVAVNVDGAGCSPEDVVRILEECGAWQVERAEGTWVAGEWADFNPVTMPHLVGGSDLATQGTNVQARH
jgi:hypothetical protein